MSYPMGSVAMMEKPAGGMKVVRDSRVFAGEWQIAPEAKPRLVVVKGKEDGKAPQVSNPFTRGKKDEPAQALPKEQHQLPSDNYFG